MCSYLQTIHLSSYGLGLTVLYAVFLDFVAQ